MKRRRFCVTLPAAMAAGGPLLASPFPPFQLSTKGTTSNSVAEKEIRELEQAMAAAAERGDAQVIMRLLAATFFAIDASGTELSTADVLARLKPEGYGVESLRHENVRVRLSGDTAVVTAHTELRATYKGADVSGRYPYVRVWQRQRAGWRVLLTVGLPRR